MVNRDRELSALVEAVDGVRTDGRHNVFVGLDGRSGAGKSTLALSLSAHLARGARGALGAVGAVTVIEGDDFYAGGSAATWDRRSIVERADRVIDWRRQRAVLEQLRNHGMAEWRAFDWEADDWDSDVIPLAESPTRARTGPVVLLEGAYACRPELHDLLDLRVLLDVPYDLRRQRLLSRDGSAYHADWDARWSGAEDHYFGTIMTPELFDLVLRPHRLVRRTD